MSILRARIVLFVPEFTEPRAGPVAEEVLSKYAFIRSTNICHTEMRAIDVLCARAKALSKLGEVPEFLEHTG